MGYQLDRLGGVVNGRALSAGIERLISIERPRFRRLWAYYRNPMRSWALGAGEQGSERPYRQAQEWGLPSRITGVRSGSEIWNVNSLSGVARKEVVIENDIGWRIETMVEYLFGKPITINSTAADTSRQEIITRLLRLILAKNGGILFLQQAALLGSIYGFVDVMVKLDPSAGGSSSTSTNGPAGAGSSKTRASTGGGDSAGQSAGIEEVVPETADASPLPLPVDPSMPETSMDGEVGTEATATGATLTAGMQDLGEKAQVKQPIDDAGDASVQLDLGAIDGWSDEELSQIASMIRLEIVEPAAAMPFLSSSDYRIIEAYAQVGQRRVDELNDQGGKRGLTQRLRESAVGRWLGYAAGLDSGSSAGFGCTTVVDIITPTRWQRYENDTLISEGENSIGVVPVVHIQNVAMPFEYSGASDVEPLIPLQDELNTRMSDRAHRISLQSFKMYLGKGIEDFTSLPVAPGRMWMTDNDKATVQEFGGDAACPSEESHLADIREALDKTSGVSPIAAGAIKSRIGRLTSAAALRITLLALLSKTDKKRTVYGTGIGRICELALLWLDRAGVFPTNPSERRIELHWPSPLPENDLETLQEAESKLRIGVAKEVVLKELGY